MEAENAELNAKLDPNNAEINVDVEADANVDKVLSKQNSGSQAEEEKKDKDEESKPIIKVAFEPDVEEVHESQVGAQKKPNAENMNAKEDQTKVEVIEKEDEIGKCFLSGVYWFNMLSLAFANGIMLLGYFIEYHTSAAFWLE